MVTAGCVDRVRPCPSYLAIALPVFRQLPLLCVGATDDRLPPRYIFLWRSADICRSGLSTASS